MLVIVLFTIMILAVYSTLLVKFYNGSIKDVVIYIFLVCSVLLLVFMVAFFATCSG